MYKWFGVLGTFFVVGGWGMTWWLLADDPNRGVFGDMFGSINALFSGLAFAGLIFTIFMQKDELKLQREELTLTRSEMATQNQTLLKQSFENTFFNLLSMLNKLVNAITTTAYDTQKPNHGQDSFYHIYRGFKDEYLKILANSKSNSLKDNALNDDEDELDTIIEAYKNIYEAVESNIGHYYKTLYYIVNFIDTSSEEDKKLYTNIIRSQFSGYELALLFYHSLSGYGSTEMKPSIEKYALLKDLPTNLLFQIEHINFHNKSAYGKE